MIASGSAAGQLLDGLAIKRKKSPVITQKLALNVTTYQTKAPHRECGNERKREREGGREEDIIAHTQNCQII